LVVTNADDEEDNIVFNSLVIVESLGKRDLKTGQLLREYINGLCSGADSDEGLTATYVSVSGRSQFVSFIHSLTEEARGGGAIPLLHIEVHGSETAGIFFADDTNLQWDDLCELITPLNMATKFRLTVVVAACFGQAIISSIRLSKPAPCFALIGPTSTMEQSEVAGVFRDFYGALLRTLNMSEAFRAIAGHTLSHGSVEPMTARHWFELLMTKYLREETTRTAIRASALRQYQNLRAEGAYVPIAELKRNFRRQLPQVIRRYFETFFLIGTVSPESRYRSVWNRIERELQEALRR
jgi:hypothetical protein